MKCDLVLDTCAFLWLTTRVDVLTAAACRAIEAAEQPGVSAISLTEIHRLQRLKRIRLPRSERTLKNWFDRALAHHGLVCAPITAEVAHAAEMLPRHHGDPADRFILATTKLNGCPVVSPDRLFAPYRLRVIW